MMFPYYNGRSFGAANGSGLSTVEKGKCDCNFKTKRSGIHGRRKKPHEKLADKELDLKAAQEVHLQDDFKKADKAAESQNGKDDKPSDENR